MRGFVFLFAVLIGAASLARADVDREACAQFGSWDESVPQTLVMEQEGKRVRLNVPRHYLEDLHDLRPEAEHKAQLFRVKRNDFQPLTRYQSSLLVRERNYDYMSFLLHDPFSLEEILDFSLSFHSPGASMEMEGFRDNPTDYFSEEEDSYGLSLLRPTTEYQAFRDVFVVRNADETLQAVIVCRPNGSVLYPGCNHDFRSSGVDVRVIYRRFNLENWESIQGDISRFIGCIVEN